MQHTEAGLPPSTEATFLLHTDASLHRDSTVHMELLQRLPWVGLGAGGQANAALHAQGQAAWPQGPDCLPGGGAGAGAEQSSHFMH